MVVNCSERLKVKSARKSLTGQSFNPWSVYDKRNVEHRTGGRKWVGPELLQKHEALPAAIEVVGGKLLWGRSSG
jgi:hypothetical protein